MTLGANISPVGSSTQLSILPGTTTAKRISQNTLNTTGIGVYVQGRYAYFADQGTGALEIWDIENPAAPVLVSSNTLNWAGFGIYVQGRYAYLADGGNTTNAFEICDVGNPAAPVRVSQNTLNAAGTGIYVQGGYAYFVGSGTTNA